MTPGWLSRELGLLVEHEPLLDVAAEAFGVTVEDLTGPERTVAMCRYRHITMAAVRQVTDLSFPAIGDLFGGRHHSTVINSCRRVERTYSAARDRLVAAMRERAAS